jgi:hypothetical protein
MPTKLFNAIVKKKNSKIKKAYVEITKNRITPEDSMTVGYS